MTDPAPATASTAYDLYYLLNGKRFFWRNPNHGVTLFDAGRQSAIIWRNDAGEVGRQLWTDIVSVNMTSGSDGKNVVNSCLIRFRDGRSLTVTDAGSSGQVDHDRTPPYRDFVRALHTRLAAAPAGTIRFTAGFSEGRHTGMVAILVIAALFFVGTPLVLLFIVRDWRVLGVLAAGIGFVWPFWIIAERNRPRAYDPRTPPGELMD
ncbi:MAG: hypothetical protein WBA48_04840 [Xanthobacteraceae bacterium]